MEKELPFILQFYDKELALLISNKYGYPIMDAYRKFLFSKTYQMLCNPELEMWDVFNMYEMYHVEALENAFADIDKLIESKTK